MAVRAAREEMERCHTAFEHAEQKYHDLRRADASVIAVEAELVGFEVEWPYHDHLYNEADCTFYVRSTHGTEFTIGPDGWYFESAYGSFLFSEAHAYETRLTDEQVFFLKWSKDWKTKLHSLWDGYYDDIETVGELIAYLKGQCNSLSKSANKS